MVIFWVGLPLALGPALRRAGWPGSAPALTVAAALSCMAVALPGFDPLTRISLLSRSQPYHDTYYILAVQDRLAGTLFLLLGAGGIAMLARGLTGRGGLARMMGAAHWSLHAGVGLLVAQALPVLPMPRRYVDYADVFFWRNLLAHAASVLAMLGAGLLAGGFLIALARLTRKGR